MSNVKKSCDFIVKLAVKVDVSTIMSFDARFIVRFDTIWWAFMKSTPSGRSSTRDPKNSKMDSEEINVGKLCLYRCSQAK
jgi:hypothetical protein